jgi:hypothetical protein
MSIRAALTRRPQQAPACFDVGANVSACHEFAKFFFGKFKQRLAPGKATVHVSYCEKSFRITT